MKVCIIGGGAAGMMAAVSASKSKNNQVIIFEKNEKLGKKLFITGKGRCNVTNNCDILDFYKNIVSNQKFMYSSFDTFNNKDMINFLEDNGLSLKIERGNRVFPTSDKSYDVTECLKRVLKKQGVVIKLEHEVKNIFVSNDDNYIEVKDVKNKKTENVCFDKLIIATGGMSYQSTGSTGDGYTFAKNIGMSVIAQEPSLVPLEVKEISECKDLMGLTLKNVAIKIYDENNKKKHIYEDFGELLYTHFGLSGPIILSASCYMSSKIVNNKNVIISIDLKPALDVKELDNRLLREIANNPKQKLTSMLKELLPHSMVDVFEKRLEDLYNFNIGKKNNELIKEDRKYIIELLKDYKYTFVKKRGFDEAIITAGGVDIKEINPKTMQSKKYNNIYFAGEVLDIDCLTGGYNLQIAWTTGYVAGLCL